MARAKKKEALSLEEKLEQALVPIKEQQYEVPPNWCWVKTKNIFDIVVGATPSTSHKEYYENGTIVWLPSGCCQDCIVEKNESNYKMITMEGYDSCSTKLMPPDTVMIALTGATAGKVGYLLFEACGNQSIVGLLPNSQVSSRFVFYQLMSRRKEILNDCVGSAQPHISKEYVSNMAMALPPLAEQQRIVEQIERLFAKLDDVKEKAQVVIEGIDINIEAIFCDAFEGRLTNEWRSKNGITDTWEDMDLSKIVSGLKYGSSEKSDYENKGTPVLRIPNIGDGVIEFSDLKYLSEEIDNTSHEVFENDILVIRSNGSRNLVGRCALVPKLDRKYAYASFLIRLKVSNRVVPQYLVYFLNSSLARIQLFSKAKSSSGIHNINSKELGAIKIKIPSLKEQEQILLLIDSLIKKEKMAREIAEMSIDSVDRMKKSILAKAFRGELGTNNSDEESAIELLKTILEQEE